jgi:DNA helicase HerA-like ATPase
MNKKQHLGIVIGGSLGDGLTMRINHTATLEQVKTGKFVSIISRNYRFFSLITDLRLEVSHPHIVTFPPDEKETLLHDIIATRDTYIIATLRPMLMLNDRHDSLPVKTVPAHFAPVVEVDSADIARIFGDEQAEGRHYFTVGYPLDMQTPVCINLEKLTERSSGIFGKTGTGKTFLTRLLLAGLIYNDKAVTIIFDMHSEYGLQARKEGANKSFVKGLKTLFSDKVAICSLDPAATRRRGGNPDIELTISYQSIQIEDIIALQEELSLHPTACEAAYLIAARYQQQWLSALLNNGARLKEFAQEIGAHPESIAALYRKLKYLERLPFLQNQQDNVVDQIMEYIDRGISIIIEFGNYTSTLCYLLIANILSRRIHAAYIEKTENYVGSHRPQDEPKKLIIVIEEAHKFLNPRAARQTIFGTIAREMRKYYVSLLIVDQRPSEIDTEIISQIGTKIIAQLNDERDIQAVLSGTNNATQLRTVLATLDSKKQVLLLGHAIAMPIVIETRSYDELFYQAMQRTIAVKPVEELIKELF